MNRVTPKNVVFIYESIEISFALQELDEQRARIASTWLVGKLRAADRDRWQRSRLAAMTRMMELNQQLAALTQRGGRKK